MEPTFGRDRVTYIDQVASVSRWCDRGSEGPEDYIERVTMDVRNIRWVGIPAQNYEAMVVFLEEVLGLRANFRDETTVEFSTSEGDEIQVMAPGDAYYDFFTANAAGPVPLFEVDDVHRARRELEQAGTEVVGATVRDSAWEWIHFRAPDGNLYELASRLPETE
jgi:catechol 2,3-dioxygenase-like lactoylglutathione lyase family enzyme